MTAIERANAEQRAASDPAVSAFVAASAGSGKTKLLTDRLLRLMLAGTPPGKILCLTYTKAAAAEMVLRLNRRLGQWVAKPQAALAAELAALDVPADEQSLALARKLFADVLDLPGGMKIGTIHAFCQSLLRRFPLEAGLSPHFALADEAEEMARLREAREQALADPAHAENVLGLAAETDETSFSALTQKLVDTPVENWMNFGPAALAEMARGALGAQAGDSEDILRAAMAWPRENHLRAVIERLAGAGNPSGKKWAARALAWLDLHPDDRLGAWEDWILVHFTKDGSALTLHGFCGKALAAEEDGIKTEISRECARIEAVRETVRTARLAALSGHFLALAGPILRGEAAQKRDAAHLSYGDLVVLTRKLLEDPGAAWILYKLDGGIDHLLLDEVQDTAPAQWEIADAIAQEFFAGAGAREPNRSLFAVGDAKQSIFSFQGADLESFQTYRAKFRDRARGAARKWLDGRLSVSFRSTAPVLELVDAVFSSGPAREGVCADQELAHGVSRVGQAGQVSLWPLAQEVPAPEPPDWAAPEGYVSAQSAKSVLARQIADAIAARIGEALPSRGRAATPGDFLILVRRRDALVEAIANECKARKIPVAGLDRMVLTAQPAVKDLLVLCDALLLPEDDLALAHFLVSPLGGLSDESLMELAIGRRGRLVGALYARARERADWREAQAYFAALRARLDYAPPFALLSEALGPLGGRARLLARLGEEAAEPIDELLAEALKFSHAEPGSLQNFVHRLRQAGAEIKREAEAGGDVVRIMTVHGAKGLQAPIVIMPDTVALPDRAQTLFWVDVPQPPGAKIPVFCPRADLRSQAVREAAAADGQARLGEYNRLLYVALTRAEDELIVCGAEGRKALPEACWYVSVRDGFSRLGARDQGNGVLVHECAQTEPPDRVSHRAAAAPVTLPSWAGTTPDWRAAPPAAETTRPERLVPSRAMQDEEARAIAASPLGEALAARRLARTAAMEKGVAVHALLEHLPGLAPAARRPAALRFLARLGDVAADEICDSVLAILDDPWLRPLFGPGSRAEVPLAGVVRDVEIGGLIDRLAVTETAVFLADYKTDRRPPPDEAGIPDKYVAQLAAYRAVLRQIHPGKAVRCLLIWTETARVMEIPAPRLDAASRLD